MPVSTPDHPDVERFGQREGSRHGAADFPFPDLFAIDIQRNGPGPVLMGFIDSL
ncbi:hypothetical protein [Methylohalobius crimeensis]|uniref:hypothetical protein n=1 Tax=Methylohalobius crimeensis TaxID=244365 RepID=UPI0013768757|nr:hypothetical protein [Methylohalobius crimeensis]